ncbi:MAG: acyl-CoA dehydrogenase family protein [Beijerinckiaceae bacterium]|nr:acyl-CoA dehydrogenase family protein [Beijerinckiaceae bacterium]MCI0735396.1 acyl-CoA dehydrogenase family protein [Beijerinckiaceae bacterium]
MDFTLGEEQELLRSQIITFCRKELNDGIRERDSAQTFPHVLWLKCGRMGLQGLPVPQDYGGTGLDPFTTAVALEALGYGCRDGGLVFSLCAHLLACVVPIWKHGTDEQKRRYLPKLCDGTLIAVNAMTEQESGSDPFTMSTRAEPDGDGFRIRGAKIFASNGPVADLALVYALAGSSENGGGVTGFLVERGTPGFRAGQTFEKMGLRTSKLGELILDDVRVSKESVLGGIGGGPVIFSESMDWERALLVATHLGTMQRLLEEAIGHARTRKAFGKSIGKFQAVSHRIVDMKVRLDAAQLLTYRAASRLGVSRDVQRDAAITKLFVSESLVTNALDTIRVFGGYGYMQDHDMERVLRDAVGGVLYSGTSDMQRNIIASWLGL